MSQSEAHSLYLVYNGSVSTRGRCIVCEEELETLLSARQYRRLWLDTEAYLGLVAECLADALAWQPTEAEPLPDALALAEQAATRIHALEQRVIAHQPKLKARGSRERMYA